MQISVKTFDSFSWYSSFIDRDGDDIEIISVNILNNGDIMVTYKEPSY